MIYVLIVIILFAALSFVLARQTDTSETAPLNREKAGLYATNILDVAAQTKSALDQMGYSGTGIDDYDFIRADQAAFDTAPNIHKVFHPEGGGVILPQLPSEAVNQLDSNPVPGWYLGRFNTVEWTESTGTDIILTAHQLNRTVCELIDLQITGSTTIPVLGATINSTLIDAADHGGGPNVDLSVALCPACEGHAQLCVYSNMGGSDMYSYYSIIEAR